MEKTPLVLVPGLLCDHGLWARQVEPLAEVADITIADAAAGTTVDEIAANLLAAAPPRFALAGLSMGGYIAFAVLRQARERVSRLCLLDTNARADRDEQKEQRRQLIEMTEGGGFEKAVRTTRPFLIHPDRMADAALNAEVDAMAERVGAETFVRQQRALLERPDSRPELGAIDVPTLVLCGREDALTPPKVHQEMADGIPGARLAIIEACGHLSPLEQPVAVTALMRLWLTGP
ncbi:alpha/beta fold hydrolase [Roseospirillum parvum]|uniref:Pimeloyl-ACP methyl ester carboxylesterase n=1 Tax=Roseospirillum parvum TaxID=83401 RepID=A0A1G7YDF6_9PROT|nr:alpha/beta fold hydrolase [Roseospirillum parvum]SDG94377.1 Pimeloyl-ACP methyl ester carboxylesterase [Roseospirillum parvum]